MNMIWICFSHLRTLVTTSMKSQFWEDKGQQKKVPTKKFNILMDFNIFGISPSWGLVGKQS